MPDVRIPQMSHHKASGQAVVRLGGHDLYLGVWGTDAAKAEYDRVVAEWLARGRPAGGAGVNDVTVTETLAAFWKHAQTYYRHADGTPTQEVRNFKYALKPLRRLYGHTPACQFGPLALKAVRQTMIDAGLCRTYINRAVNRVRHVFKWAAENELVPGGVYHPLQAVAGLKAGRSDATESKPVRPVPAERVEATLPHASSQVAAMVRLQLLTGMRPGEVIVMRGSDLDRSGPVWFYRPEQHKGRHLGHERVVFVGPRAQEILKPFLKPDPAADLFSPAEAEARRREALGRARRTPLFCGNRPGTNVKAKPRKKPGDHYSVISYAKAVYAACDAAFPLPEHLRPKRPDDGGRGESRKAWLARLSAVEKAEVQAHRAAHRWHPHQLRHSAATDLRKRFGLEPAQVILGHKTLTVTQVYAERNVEAAIRVVGEVG
jgi:integrase